MDKLHLQKKSIMKIKKPNNILRHLLVCLSYFVQNSLDCTNVSEMQKSVNKLARLIKEEEEKSFSLDELDELDEREKIRKIKIELDTFEFYLKVEKALEAQVRKRKNEGTSWLDKNINSYELDEYEQINPICAASLLGRSDIVGYLLEMGAKVEYEEGVRASAINAAVEFSFPRYIHDQASFSYNMLKKFEIVKKLLTQKKSIINEQGKGGNTILMKMLEILLITTLNNNNKEKLNEFIGYLLSMGADLESITNQDGETALDIAESVKISREELLKMKSKSIAQQQASNTTTKSNTNDNKKTNEPKPNNIISWMLIGGGVILIAFYFLGFPGVKLEKGSELEGDS